MKLYITNRELPSLCGIVIKPKFMPLKMTHLTLASQSWDAIYIDVEEEIPEGTLRFLPSKSSEIYVHCPEHPSLHQLHLLTELYPDLGGKLRKTYLKGDEISGVLPKMWEHGDTDRRDSM